MSKASKLSRQRRDAAAMYDILNELQHVAYTQGGHVDDLMRVAAKALHMIRRIDNPDLGIPPPKK